MKRTTLTLLGAVSVAAACSNSLAPGSKPQASLSFSTRIPASAGPTSPLFSMMGTGADTLTNGSDVLIISKAEVVLGKIELKKDQGTVCTGTLESNDCDEFEAGPVLVDLPLGAGAQQTVAVAIPAGTYTELQFRIHKLTADAPADATIRAARPDLVGKSIHVEGKFNGTAFAYSTDLDVEQELALIPALVVTDGTVSTNVTIRLVTADWFKSATGGLVDPATGNTGGANESLVKENIKQSMKAFKDDNENGDEKDEK